MFFQQPYKQPHTTHYTSSSSVNVTEKRAPTDESVRLLREMEAKARDEVIRAIAVNDNQFNGVIHSLYDPMSAGYRLIMIYTINGKKLTTHYNINSMDETPDKWIPGFIKAVADDVAIAILAKPITDAIKNDIGLRGKR